jgi:hypothetical protein
MLSGCASARQSDIERQAAAIKVYQPDQLLPSQYKVARHLWADSWRTVDRVQRYSHWRALTRCPRHAHEIVKIRFWPKTPRAAGGLDQ